MGRSEYKNIKKELDTVFRLIRESETKFDKRINTESTKLNQVNLDVTEINANLKNLVDTTKKFIDNFEKHDENEMAKYDDIEATNKETNDRLSKLENAQKSRTESTNEMKDTIESMQKSQQKFYKYFYIGTGIISTIIGLGSLLMFILNLMSKIPEPLRG